MKYTKLLVFVAAATLLTGCAKATSSGKKKTSSESSITESIDTRELTEQEFLEKVEKIPAHQYTNATAKYDISYTGSGFFVGQTEHIKSEAECYYDNGSWTSDSTDGYDKTIAASIFTLKEHNLADDLEQMKKTYDSFEYEAKYFKKPLQIDYTFKIATATNGLTITIDSTNTYVFDEYGFIVRMDSTTKENIYGVASEMEINGTLDGTSVIDYIYYDVSVE